MIRLLITARDPAAAWNMAEVAREAMADGRFEVHLHAAGPAFGILSRCGLPVRQVHATAVVGESGVHPAAVLEEAAALLAHVSPDAVLVGLSQTGGGGIDEALLALAENVPRFALQDFWGDVNTFFGRPADLYFVMDDEAARLTTALHGVAAQAVGCPRYASYAALDVGELRRGTRQRLGVGQDTPLIGLFSQPLWHVPGYWRTLETFAAAAATHSALALLRPHPRERDEDVAAMRQLLENAGLRIVPAIDGASEPLLAACDAICSAFSLSGLDALYLARQSTELPAGVLYMLFDAELQACYRATSRLDTVPLVQLGLALAPDEIDALPYALGTALSRKWRSQVARSIGDLLPQAAGAARAILNRISTMAVS